MTPKRVHHNHFVNISSWKIDPVTPTKYICYLVSLSPITRLDCQTGRQPCCTCNISQTSLWLVKADCLCDWNSGPEMKLGASLWQWQLSPTSPPHQSLHCHQHQQAFIWCFTVDKSWHMILNLLCFFFTISTFH